MLRIIRHHANKKRQKYLINFNGSRQHSIHHITLYQIRAAIGLLSYGGVFESSPEDLESLNKLDGTGRLNFPAVMEKNFLSFLLSMMRSDNKATTAERRLNNTLAVFREIWDMLVETCN